MIKAVSQSISGELRSTDHLGRLGGEEFGVLLGQAEQEVAVEISERIRLNVSALSVPGLCGERVSISLSLARYCAKVDSVTAWMAAADRALYEAKRAGLGRVAEAA